ncbi:hypothetical protein BV898_06296 [Hypsibius exemplaris]|uniref:Gustatory receptor n=1 Tax=Hypsibius exemplaris TaxID=2072580 RepID=A0A1W0WX32_HYPEX|nr:hypothetical protein BV898_06296 [Hypsibius exemplaris]
MGSAQGVITNVLSFAGVLRSPKHTRSTVGSILRTSILAIACSLSLIYRCTSYKFVNEGDNVTLSKLSIFQVIDYSQYIIRTLGAITVMAIVWRKSGILLTFQRENRAITKVLAQPRSPSGFGVLILVTFILFIVIMSVARVCQYLLTDIKKLNWDERTNISWLRVTFLQDQMFTAFVSYPVESLRLLSLGFVANVIVEFSHGTARACLEILEESASLHDLIENLPKAWAARETSLGIAMKMRSHLTVVLTMAMMFDILCLNAVLCNFLQPGSGIFTLVRSLVSVMIYVVEILVTCRAVMRLNQIDDATLSVVQQLQSSLEQELQALENGKADLLHNNRALWRRELQTLRSHLSKFSVVCFRERNLSLPLYGLGIITHRTVLSIIGLLSTFLLFLMEQRSPPGPTTGCNGTNRAIYVVNCSEIARLWDIFGESIPYTTVRS